MQEIITKRTTLMNFFKNENKTYSKEEILNKEFAVLSFSPHEEYIDSLESPFDDLCVDLSTFEFDDYKEVYMKGIITDIDKKNGYTIFHIQNKDALASITASGATLQKYDNHIIVGEPVIVKCNIFKGRPYLSFLINISDLSSFKDECFYMEGKAFKKIDELMAGREKERFNYGVIVQCKLTKTKKDKEMVIGSLYDGKEVRDFATVKTYYNKYIPKEAVAGDYVRFDRPSREFTLNNMRVVEL